METLSTTKTAKQQTVKINSDLNVLTRFSNYPNSVSESLFLTAIANIFSSGKNCLKADGRKFNFCLSINS